MLNICIVQRVDRSGAVFRRRFVGPAVSLTALALEGALARSPGVALAVGGHLAVALAVGAVVRWRGRRYYRDPATDADTAAHLRRLRRWGVLAGWLLTTAVTFAFGVGPLLAGALVVVAAGAAAIALAPPGWPRALVAVGLGLVATALTPVALVVALRTRWPTDAELATLEGVLGDVRLRVVDDRTRVGSALAAGVVPGLRYVFLTESLFELLDDDELRAVVAHEVGHHERNHVLLRFSLVALAAGAALALASVLPPGRTLVVLGAGALPAAVGFAWVVRATERSADAYAARAVGGPALASALERLARHRYVADATGPTALLSYHPPLSERVATLREPGG